jgi:flavorubredoxin
MYHSTEKMALRFEELLEKKGIPSRLMNLEKFHISDIVTEVLTSNYVLFGSPILNNRILPTMAALLMYLKGLKPKNRKSLAFGSFGWSTVGFKEFEEQLREAGFSLLGEGAYYKFAPDAEELEGLSKYIDQIN